MADKNSYLCPTNQPPNSQWRSPNEPNHQWLIARTRNRRCAAHSIRHACTHARRGRARTRAPSDSCCCRIYQITSNKLKSIVAPRSTQRPGWRARARATSRGMCTCYTHVRNLGAVFCRDSVTSCAVRAPRRGDVIIFIYMCYIYAYA